MDIIFFKKGKEIHMTLDYVFASASSELYAQPFDTAMERLNEQLNNIMERTKKISVS